MIWMFAALLLIALLYWAFAITSRVKHAEQQVAALWRAKANTSQVELATAPKKPVTRSAVTRSGAPMIVAALLGAGAFLLVCLVLFGMSGCE